MVLYPRSLIVVFEEKWSYDRSFARAAANSLSSIARNLRSHTGRKTPFRTPVRSLCQSWTAGRLRYGAVQKDLPIRSTSTLRKRSKRLWS